MSNLNKAGSLLREIERWKLEAKNEDNSRYFIPFEELDEVTSGEAIYVIGRKGCGKTAIVEHLRNLTSHDLFAKTLSFKYFPFNDLYGHTDGRFTSKSQYITFWKYVIYSTVCQQLSSNEAISPEASVPLKAHFNMDFNKSLSRSFSEITQKTGAITILKGGISGGITKTFVANNTPWIDRVDGLED